MRHDHGESGRLGREAVDEIGGGRDDEMIGGGEAGDGRESGAGVGDGDGPTQLAGERGEGLGVVAGTKDEERRRGAERLAENLGVDRGKARWERGGEVSAEGEWWLGSGVLPDDGEFGRPAGGEIGGDGRDPRGCRGRDRLEQDLDDAVAA